MMESTEATESMTSLYDNIGKTTVVSTLDSCKGSKLREVENSCSSVDLRSTFHRCRKSQGEPGKEIGRRLEGNTNYCCSDNMRDLGYNYTIPKYLKLFLCVVAFRVCMTWYTQKSTVWPKSTLNQKWPVEAAMNLGFLTLGGAVGQTSGTRSTSMVHMESLGYNGPLLGNEERYFIRL